MSVRSKTGKRRRAVIGKVRRAVRRRVRKTVHRTARRIRTRVRRYRARRAARRIEMRRVAAAQPLAVRSITGKARPVLSAPTAAAKVPTANQAAPMTQRVKRGKGGKFAGSTGAAKKTTAKKTGKKAAPMTAAEREAARTARTLAAGNKRVARIDKRTRG